MSNARRRQRSIAFLAIAALLLQGTGCASTDFAAFINDFAHEALAAALF